MRTLMLLEHHYPPDIRVEKEIISLIEAGHQVVLACCTQSGKDGVKSDDGLIIYRKRISPFIYKSSVGALKFPFYFSFWRNFLSQVLKKESVQAIHVHDLPLACLGLEIKKKCNIPIILDSHENYPFMLAAAAHTQTLPGKLLSSNRQWFNYEKKMLDAADAVLSIVAEQKKRFQGLGIAKEKIFIVSNTPNYQRISSSIPKTDKFTFVYAGNIYASKGLDIMVNAFELVNKQYPDTNLWIVGDVRKWSRSEKQPTNNNSIRLWGWQQLEKLLQIVAAADAALLPHLKNMNSDYGIPNKLFQYMMAGKPVIASNCTPIQRIIKETESGLIYMHNDIQDLAEKMKKLYNDRKSAAKMGVNGHKAVKEKYNWDSEKESLINAYDFAARN